MAKSRLIVPDIKSDPRWKAYAAQLHELTARAQAAAAKRDELKRELQHERNLEAQGKATTLAVPAEEEGGGVLTVVSRASLILGRLMDADAEARYADQELNTHKLGMRDLVMAIVEDLGGLEPIQRAIRDEIAVPMAEATERILALMRQQEEFHRQLSNVEIPTWNLHWPPSLIPDNAVEPIARSTYTRHMEALGVKVGG